MVHIRDNSLNVSWLSNGSPVVSVTGKQVVVSNLKSVSFISITPECFHYPMIYCLVLNGMLIMICLELNNL